MEIYVLGCTFSFSPFYCLCIDSEPYHSPIINYTQSTSKTIKTKNSNPFTILFHQTLHMYNNFVSSEGVSKSYKHLLIYYLKKTQEKITYHMVSHVISHKINKG